QRQAIGHGPTGDLEGRFQSSHPGSYALMKSWTREPLLDKIDGLEVSFHVQPWMLDAEYPQAILSTLDTNKRAGLAVLLGTRTDLLLWIVTPSGVETIRVAFNVRRERWFHTRLTIKSK